MLISVKMTLDFENFLIYNEGTRCKTERKEMIYTGANRGWKNKTGF